MSERDLDKADGLHCQLYVKDGKLVMNVDADPGCRDAMLHTDRVLRIAADQIEESRRLATTLGPRGCAPKQYVN